MQTELTEQSTNIGESKVHAAGPNSNVLESEQDIGTLRSEHSVRTAEESQPLSSPSVNQLSTAASFFARAGQRLTSNSTWKTRRKSGQLPTLSPSLMTTGANTLFKQQQQQQFSKRLLTNFSETAHHNPPPVPPNLLRLSRNGAGCAGTGVVADKANLQAVKVILQIQPPESSHLLNSATCVTVDQSKKQVTLTDPTPNSAADQYRTVHSAPRIFAPDAIFTEEDSMIELCSCALTDLIQAVVNGTDSCLICLGSVATSQSATTIGDDKSCSGFGLIPCALSWLFRLINEQKERTGARFSVRVSAVEVYGKGEVLQDLLSTAAEDGAETNTPSVYLREDPISGTQLENQSELRAPTPEKAAFYLDCALTALSRNVHKNERHGSPPPISQTPPTSSSGLEKSTSSPPSNLSHLFFTVHVYQYRVERCGGGSGVAGGRSRLHLIELGGGLNASGPSQTANEMSEQDPPHKPLGSAFTALSSEAILSVLLALVSGQRHIPYRDSKLSQLLRESMGNISCRASIVVRTSALAQQYYESLALLQFINKIQRLQKRRLRSKAHGIESSGSEWSSSQDERSIALTSSEDSSSCGSFGLRRVGRLRMHHGGLRSALKAGVHSKHGGDNVSMATSSERDYTSSSEQSCDTVIFLGRRGIQQRIKLQRLAPESGVETQSDTSEKDRSKKRGDEQSSGSNEASSKEEGKKGSAKSRRRGSLPFGDARNADVKRSVARTNAHAWPRAAVKNAIETLSTQKEQWVDGPKADFSPSHSLLTSEHQPTQLQPSKPAEASGSTLISDEKTNVESYTPATVQISSETRGHLYPVDISTVTSQNGLLFQPGTLLPILDVQPGWEPSYPNTSGKLSSGNYIEQVVRHRLHSHKPQTEEENQGQPSSSRQNTKPIVGGEPYQQNQGDEAEAVELLRGTSTGTQRSLGFPLGSVTDPSVNRMTTREESVEESSNLKEFPSQGSPIVERSLHNIHDCKDIQTTQGLTIEGLPKTITPPQTAQGQRITRHHGASIAKVKPFVKDWVRKHSGVTSIPTEMEEEIRSNSIGERKIETNKPFSICPFGSGQEHGRPPEVTKEKPSDHKYRELRLPGKIPRKDGELEQAQRCPPDHRPTAAPHAPPSKDSAKPTSNFARIAEWVKSVSMETCDSPNLPGHSSVKPQKFVPAMPVFQTPQHRPVSASRNLQDPCVSGGRLIIYQPTSPENQQIFLPRPLTKLPYGNAISPHVQFPLVVKQTSTERTKREHMSLSLTSSSQVRPRRGRSVPPGAVTLVDTPPETSKLQKLERNSEVTRNIPSYPATPIPLSFSTGPIFKEKSRHPKDPSEGVADTEFNRELLTYRRPDGCSNPHLHREQADDKAGVKRFGHPEGARNEISADADGKPRRHGKILAFLSHSRKTQRPTDHSAEFSKCGPISNQPSLLCAAVTNSPKKFFSPELEKRYAKRIEKGEVLSRGRYLSIDRTRKRSQSYGSSTDSCDSTGANNRTTAPQIAASVEPLVHSGTQIECPSKVSKDSRMKLVKERLSFLTSPIFNRKKERNQSFGDKEDNRQQTTDSSKTRDHSRSRQKQLNPLPNFSTSGAPVMSQSSRSYSQDSENVQQIISIRPVLPLEGRCPHCDKSAKQANTKKQHTSYPLVHQTPVSTDPNKLRHRITNEGQTKISSLQSSSGHGSECSSNLLNSQLSPERKAHEGSHKQLRCRCKRHHHRHKQRASSQHRNQHHSKSLRSESQQWCHHPSCRTENLIVHGQMAGVFSEDKSGTFSSNDAPDGMAPRFPPTEFITHGHFHCALAPRNAKDTSIISALMGTRRGGGRTSSGYESILRDSEASSHADSASGSSILGIPEGNASPVERVDADGSHSKSQIQHNEMTALYGSSNIPSVRADKNDDARSWLAPSSLKSDTVTTITRQYTNPDDGVVTNQGLSPCVSAAVSSQPADSCSTLASNICSSRRLNDNKGPSNQVTETTQPNNSQSASSSSSTSRRSRSAPPCSEDTSEETTSSPISVRYVPPKTTETFVSSVSTSTEHVGIGKETEECVQQASSESRHRKVVQEMLRQIRYEKIYDLLAQQDMLKAELMTAKNRLMVDPSTWSFDLYVADQMDPDDPGFLEALEKETNILRKRVDACKSHILLVTCFDVQAKSNNRIINLTSSY